MSGSSPVQREAEPSSPNNIDSPKSFSTPTLTPRSKVRALLASFSDDSEEDDLQRKESPVKRTNADTSNTITGSSSATVNNADASDDGAIDSPGPVSAYERVRRQLIAAEPDKSSEAILADRSSQNEASQRDDNEANEKDAIQSSKPRRRKLIGRTRRSDNSTPAQSPMNSNTSPPKPASAQRSLTSPVSSRLSNTISSEDELSENPTTNKRFLALIERKRKEKQSKDAEEDEKRKMKQMRLQEQLSSTVGIESDQGESEEDDDSGKRLTQQARPTRKAGRKAIEEMQRETQRMARNMQLAHEARTKKRVTTQSLLDKFNFRTAVTKAPAPESRAKSSSSVPVSDVEGDHSTPPSSPPSLSTSPQKQPITRGLLADDDDDNDVIPSMEDLLAEMKSAPIVPAAEVSVEKNTMLELDALGNTASLTETKIIGPKFKGKDRSCNLLPSREAFLANRAVFATQDDIEVLPEGAVEPLTIWDKAMKKEAVQSKDLLALRALAHLTSPSKQRSRKGKHVDFADLQVNLQRKARQQAMKEREARLQDLRNKGIIIQTAEERAQEAAEVEDLIAKARQDERELRKKEHADAKRDGEDDQNGALDDDSEDGEWNEEPKGPQHDDAKEDDGSEDGDDEDEEDDEEEQGSEDENDNIKAATRKRDSTMLDVEASEDSNNEEDEADGSEIGDFINDGEEADQSDDMVAKKPLFRRTQKRAIFDSDEEESAPAQILAPARTPLKKSITPKSAQKIVIPGLPMVNDISMGLTQIFAGTMDDSQPQGLGISQTNGLFDPEQDSIAFLRQTTVPSLPLYDDVVGNNVHVNIPDSQDNLETQTQPEYLPEVRLGYSQQPPVTPGRVAGLPSNDETPQQAEMPDPTQDGGFARSSPIADRFDGPEPSTVDTVPIADALSPPARKRRLRKGRLAIDSDESEEDQAAPTNPDKASSTKAFAVMKKAAERRAKEQADFNKKKSGAKGMVEEQAEESEDEYAGLGGASDDESGEEDDEFNRAMVDDEGPDANERELAAFHADKERVKDGKEVEKLFNDISKGLLRRKRGADYSLSDSDDDGEARRRRKRREFAKMRKALLEDNKEVGKIAQDPRKQAFLLAIEDRDPDDDLDFLDKEEIPTMLENSESQSAQPTQAEDGQEQDGHIAFASRPSLPKRKRSGDDQEARLPPHLRRTKGNHPSGLAEIRKTLSFLTDKENEHNDADQAYSSDVEAPQHILLPDLETENLPPTTTTSTNPRRTNAAPQIIDRLSLLRQQSSSSCSNSGNNPTTPLAFATSSSTPQFKIPSMLRRTTTASSNDSVGSVTYGDTERSSSLSNDKAGIRKPSSKASSVNFRQRENGQRSILEQSKKRHADMVKRKVDERRGVLSKLKGNWC